jgi:hypothetical protein
MQRVHRVTHIEIQHVNSHILFIQDKALSSAKLQMARACHEGREYGASHACWKAAASGSGAQALSGGGDNVKCRVAATMDVCPRDTRRRDLPQRY